MSQGIQASTGSLGNNYKGYNALIQPAVSKTTSLQPSVAQQLNRLQAGQQVTPANFQDLYENTISQKPVTANNITVESNKPQELAKTADTASLPVQKSVPSTTTEQRSAVGNDYYQQLMPLIKDVQNIAKNSGYVDVRADDVMRAYAQGSSLLADYSV